MDNIRVLSTIHRIIHDVITVLSNPNSSKESFEVGCRCKSSDNQDYLFNVLSAIFKDDIKVYKLPEDYTVCVKKEKEKEVTDSEIILQV